jgi:hypothetical protein
VRCCCCCCCCCCAGRISLLTVWRPTCQLPESSSCTHMLHYKCCRLCIAASAGAVQE